MISGTFSLGRKRGERVNFCCPGSIETFQKNPEQYLKKLERQGMTPEKSPGGNYPDGQRK